MIPYGRHYLNREDLKTVKKVLNSDYLTQGPIVKKFENDIPPLVKLIPPLVPKNCSKISNGDCDVKLP